MTDTQEDYIDDAYQENDELPIEIEAMMNEMTLEEATKTVVNIAWACTVDNSARYFKEEDYWRDMTAIEIVKASFSVSGETGDKDG